MRVSADGDPGERHQPGHSLRLEDILAFCGAAPVMLRREDISLHDPEAKTLREKKVSDLHNRAQLVGELEGAVLVSIHQNTFPQSKYHAPGVLCPHPGLPGPGGDLPAGDSHQLAA